MMGASPNVVGRAVGVSIAVVHRLLFTIVLQLVCGASSVSPSRQAWRRTTSAPPPRSLGFQEEIGCHRNVGMLCGENHLVQILSHAFVDTTRQGLSKKSGTVLTVRPSVSDSKLVNGRFPPFGMLALPVIMGITLRITMPSDLVSFFYRKSSNTKLSNHEGESEGRPVDNRCHVSSRFSFGAFVDFSYTSAVGRGVAGSHLESSVFRFAALKTVNQRST
ncbi:hypothetical protein B0T25DRAFT_546254 [Lasiosphaeria hispida]|uniref:Uncharacterized protein n=1 Tax=Lasiosphaeria hispida TaxID=260671 RepID=A0AAJ0HD51_9PEZI|nr:hypothetical protein B0T25DRAFT_546254 [Lasiosphaeria hispida]